MQSFFNQNKSYKNRNDVKYTQIQEFKRKLPEESVEAIKQKIIHR